MRTFRIDFAGLGIAGPMGMACGMFNGAAEVAVTQQPASGPRGWSVAYIIVEWTKVEDGRVKVLLAPPPLDLAERLTDAFIAKYGAIIDERAGLAA